MTAPLVRPAGDSAVLIELAENDQVHALAAHLRAALGARVSDVVPGHRSLLVAWDAAGGPPANLEALLGDALASPPPTASEPATIGVRYDGADLGDVARRLGISPEELVARHTAPTYAVGFVGFAAGFGYLLGGDPLLALPRRDEPRQRVPAGAVAIAGPYTACYPTSGPGGWHLLGTTDARLFDPDREPPALMAPGAAIRFEAVRA